MIQTRGRPVLFDGRQQPLRPAGPGVAFPPVGHVRGDTGDVKATLGSSVSDRELVSALIAPQGGEFICKHHLVGSRHRVDMHDVTDSVAALHGSQHRHHRGDTGSAGQEEYRSRRRVTHGEVAPWSGQTNNRARPDSRNEVGGQETLRHGLDGDRDSARTAVPRGRRQRIRPPSPAAVDKQADPDVLPGLVVEAEAPSGSDHQSRRVTGLGADLDDPAAKFARGPQRIDELEIVVRQQWGGDAA